MKLLNFVKPLLILLIMNSCNSLSQNPEKESVAYIGTYTKKEGHVNGQAEGIYSVYREKNGDLRMGKTVAEITNPSFVKTSSDGKNLYAVSELGGGDAESGFIYSYKINPDHSLEELGKISTESFAPCHIATDQSGKFVFVSNYVGGVVMMYNRKPDGNLEKQQKITFEDAENSHPHSVNISSDNKHAYIADLGHDKIWIFDLDAENGKLVPNDQEFISLKRGSGPRHFSFSKNEDFAYSINELNSSVSVFERKDSGGLTEIQNVSSLPEGFSEKNSAADIHLHPSGKYLYVSNRGHNSIAAFEINEDTGKITSLQFTPTQGSTPRNFSITPGGDFLYAANQDSNSISAFKINTTTGTLKPYSEPLEVMTPVCIEFLN